jgi:Cd2+/Zn2+-exporting ATPase
VVVRPGDRVPADGTILSGSSSLDESALTGESMPRNKGEGDVVLAGSINQEAVLRVKVEKPATDTVIARVVRLVEEATEAKAPSERFIDEFSRYYMPAICGIALAVVLVPPLFFGGTWDTWIYRGLTLLLIGCPCALVISTPAAIASSLAAGARRGLLVKGGAVIEQIGKVKHIVFDKTGTLTEGKPRVTDVQTFGSATQHEVLTAAGAVEAGSSHPLAVSIMAHAKENGIAITAADDNEAMPGKGVRGKVNGQEIVVGAAGRLDLDTTIVIASEALEGHGKSVSVVLADGKPIGLIALRDEPRTDAREELAVIKALGLVPIMLTGDNKANGEAIAAALGIEARTELLPEDKLNIVKELAGQGGVAVVGDGINDAPALAAATVGIAMGSGTDVALEAGDAAILNNRIADVAALIVLSRHTMAIVRQNVSLALGLKAVFLVTTLFGLTGLWIAVLADTGATVLVTANALRLLRWSHGRS